jgi:hypothetical protein
MSSPDQVNRCEPVSALHQSVCCSQSVSQSVCSVFSSQSVTRSVRQALCRVCSRQSVGQSVGQSGRQYVVCAQSACHTNQCLPISASYQSVWKPRFNQLNQPRQMKVFEIPQECDITPYACSHYYIVIIIIIRTHCVLGGVLRSSVSGF